MSENIDQKILLNAVQITMKELFPHNQKYFVLHDNTDNNHVHITIGKTSYNPDHQKRLHIDKRKLVAIKKDKEGSLEIIKVDSNPFEIKKATNTLFKFGQIISIETNLKEKELLIQFASEKGIELITKRGKEAKDLLHIKNELIGKHIRISNTENKKISLLSGQITVPILRQKKIHRGFKI